MGKYEKYSRPKGFETPQKALEIRKGLRRGIRSLKHPPLRKYLWMGPCTFEERCLSGLCPICVRRLRSHLINFAEKNQLHKREWYFLTIKVDQWRMEPGNYQTFADFVGEPGKTPAEIRAVKALKMQLKRAYDGLSSQRRKAMPLRVIGSIETQYDQVANKPNGKPFHIHLLISGLTIDEIRKSTHAFALKNSCSLHGRPIDIRHVGSSPDDFVNTLSYCVKQPFWKKAFVNHETMAARMVGAKPNELAELAANISKIPLKGRLIMMGIKYFYRNFSLL